MIRNSKRNLTVLWVVGLFLMVGSIYSAIFLKFHITLTKPQMDLIVYGMFAIGFVLFAKYVGFLEN